MLHKYRENLKYDAIVEKLKIHQQLCNIPRWDSYKKLLANFVFPAKEKIHYELDATICVSCSDPPSNNQNKEVTEIVSALIPWRLGPYSFLGVEVDAEWRSYFKWQRLVDHIDSLENKRIADIGCNNGYHMLRMAQYNPELVIGIDPSDRCYHQFDFMQRFFNFDNLHYLGLEAEDIKLFPEFFDIIVCMGVIYHRRDPYTALQHMKEALKVGGQIIIESLCIPDQSAVCLCPEDRYMKMRNVWYVPSTEGLRAWLRKVGFADIEVIASDPLSFEEQRQTHFAPYESLSDFLDTQDPSKTIEGYPAPLRVMIKARKK